MVEFTLPSQIDVPLKQMAWMVFRVAKEWSEIVSEMRSDVEDQGNNEDDYIYAEVKDQVGRIIRRNEKPDEAYIKIHGVTVRKKILHRKSENNNGADLLLDIEDKKFVLIQFKKQNSRGRFDFKKDQFDDLRKYCRFCNQDNFLPPQCPSFIWLVDDSGYYTTHRLLRLCEIERILSGRMSASTSEFYYDKGIYRSTFKELFIKCWVGAKYEYKPSDKEMIEYSDTHQKYVVNYSILDQKT